MDWTLLYIFLPVISVNGLSITFNSKPLEVINESTLDDVTKFHDPKDTGSHLFHSSDELDKVGLSLNILIRDFRSPSSTYFRAHPVFITCIQNVITKLRKQNLKVQIVSGYKTSTDAGTGLQIVDDYARSGCGIQLKYKDGVNGDLLDIAKTTLQICPEQFERIQRDVGIVLMSDRIHIHMTGSMDAVPHFEVSGYGGLTTAGFQTLVVTQINEGIDAVISPNCSLYNGIDSGGVYPPGGASLDAVVGSQDEQITRKKTDDFKKLVQYLGTNIEFADEERSASWCGSEENACVDCRNGYVGNSLDKRCADRLMTAKMYNVIKPLQKMVRSNLVGDTLKILESWDEPYDGHTSGDNPPDSIHYEGRAVKLQLSVCNTPENLKIVSKYAICAGVDYVAHNNDHLLLAVKKMKGYEEANAKTTFPKTFLLAVEPPAIMASEYALPEGAFSDDEADDYPLFDSNNMEDVILADNSTVRQFISKEEDIRYFRLSPRIVQCYSALVYHENKWSNGQGQPVNIEVIRGFISNSEQRGLFEETDKRYNTHNLGVAMQIKYGDEAPDSHTSSRLAQRVIDKCSPIFNEDDERPGIGLYSDSVFVDIRSPDDEYLLWVEKDDLVPDNMTFEQYKEFMTKRTQLAIQMLIVDPDDLDEACNLAVVPELQSPFYEYKLPEVVRRKRKRRSSSNKCVPVTDTEFCTSTKRHRDEIVEAIWKEMDRKHIYHDTQEFRTALEGCFGACGTCLEGLIFDDKRKHCSNLLHWMNFVMMNDAPDITNFFARDNLVTRKYACTGGNHCLMLSPAFAIVAPSVKKIYRPDETKSVEEELYSSEENPSPVFPSLDELYAIHARGTVSFWVQDEKEMPSMKEPLVVAMMYNQNVTDIKIYVTNSISKGPVSALVESYVVEMATTGCPFYTRTTLAPFQVLDIPHHVQKRSTSREDEAKEKFLIDRMNFELRHLDF